jgi:flagellar hook assembly protein FlgD
VGVPIGYALRQNYPNPFNPSTKISFEIPVSSTVTLRIFNMIGQEVKTLFHGTLSAGSQELVWNGTDDAGRTLASGVYFYSLNAVPVAGGKTFSEVRKMVLLK